MVSTINAIAELQQNAHSPVAFFNDMSKFVSGAGWRGFNDYIGARIYYNGLTEEIKDQVSNSPLIAAKVAALAENQLQREYWLRGSAREARKRQLILWLQDLADQQIDMMVCRMESTTTLRTLGFTMLEFIARAYHQGVHVDKLQIARLLETAKLASQKGISLVFLPSHKSHVDYIALYIICYRFGISMPVTVAGDNLNFAVAGKLLNNIGAMWIRRSFNNDELYATSVQAYIDTILTRGMNFDCFIEGGRSRTGKVLPPKYGILTFVLDSIFSGRVNDCYVIPVSCQYDKVIETESYISELLGKEKKKETLLDTLKNFDVMSLKLGRVDVRFHEAWSLRDYLTTKLHSRPEHSVSELSALDTTTRNWLIRSTGYKVLGDINAASMVMPSSIVATVLLTMRGRGIGYRELIRQVTLLVQRINNSAGKVADHTSPQQLLSSGVEVLGSMVGTERKGLLETTFYAADPFQLSFYRNMVIHLFISEAIVCIGIYTSVKRISSITYDELMQEVIFFSKLFSSEFIYPNNGIESNVKGTLMNMQAQNILKVNDNVIQLSEEEEIALRRENFDFYCFLIWPFVDGIWLAAVSLFALTPTIQEEATRKPSETLWIDREEFEKVSQSFGKTIYQQGEIQSYESVNKELLKSSYEKFISEGILLTRTSYVRIPRKLIALSPDWLPARNQHNAVKCEGKLWDFVGQISKGRREGKSRREIPDITSQVLGLSGEMALGFARELREVRTKRTKL
ncbi:hypothetical protein CANCADRAFT_28722 [Tortispora caseinolytica NRRL Y-17796]|uniref:Phospholipid/glycerol acyltransferase domain-containing protein n=1 Tax=Tortispora caseinolytica NRRL Y-17796 TaxID=767744 RepID=A0A1E4TCZ1_9ASCO|nr:hypothetical protein CANCADRAFT_28722 [Tortispora caseinolytica NRRL Y-17796]